MKTHFATILITAILFTPALIPVTVSADTKTEDIKTDIVKKASTHSVKETMDKLEALVISKGLSVFARVDHKKNAEGVKMKLNDAEVLIFGNPKAGTLLMQDDISIALDLPMRVAVYKDTDDKVWITYHNPQGFKDTHSLSKDKILSKLEGGLDKLTSAVTQ